MRLNLILTMCCFFAMFACVITQQKDYGLHRALVLLQEIITGKYFVPTIIEKDLKTNDEDKPYHFVGGFTYYFCPVNNEKYACLIGYRNKGKNKAYYCENPIQPVAKQLGTCSVNNRSGTLYAIGYELCDESKQLLIDRNQREYEINFLTEYKFCYNHEAKRTLYVDYQMYPQSLLNSEQIIQTEKDCNPDFTSVNYMDAFGNDFEEMERIMQQQETEKKLLAPKFHFPFIQLRRPLFHYSNSILVQPYLSNLFHTGYYFIERMIGDDSNRIFAVAINDHDGPINTSTYTPQIVGYLIVTQKETRGIAFILHNEPEPEDKQITIQCTRTVPCTKDEMNVKRWLEDKGLKNNLAYCCDINEIMEKWNFNPFDKNKRIKPLTKNELFIS